MVRVIEDSAEGEPVFDKVWSSDRSLAEINPAQIHRRRQTKKLLRKLGINPRSILDIGCGTGELIKELFHVYPNADFYGCDISSEAEKLTMTALPSTRFYCLNVEKPQEDVFKKGMDLITCCEVLEHCSSPDQVIKNAYLWINEGGLFFFSVPAGPKTAYDSFIGHQHHYTIEEIKQLLISEGFCDVYAKYWGSPFHTFYRALVGIASSQIEYKNSGLIDAKSNRWFFAYWLFCKVFNMLFYLNFLNSGNQIFGWGHKKCMRGGADGHPEA